MIFRKPAPPQTLSAWLDLATKDLVPSAQARIRAEIEAHYVEAVSVYQENGRSEINASAAALADLGNVRAAARRFCRKYLTRRELLNDAIIMKVCREDKDDTKPRKLGDLSIGDLFILLTLWTVYFDLTDIKRSHIPDTYLAVLVFFKLVTGIGTIISSFCYPRTDSVQAILRQHYIHRVGFWLYFFLYSIELQMNSFGIFCSLLCAVIMPFVIYDFLIFRHKLAFVTDDELTSDIEAIG